MGSLSNEDVLISKPFTNVSSSIWHEHVSSKIYEGGFIQMGPEEALVPKAFADSFETVQNFKSKEGDIWVVTHPKSGTTWTQEMVWLICNDLDFNGALSKKLIDRSPFFEFGAFWPKRAKGLERIDNAQSPRVLKSHLHLSLLPDDVKSSLGSISGPKVIYTMRNPKSVCLSYYHHTKAFDAYSGTLEEFAQSFMDGNVIWSPYAAHVSNYFKLKDMPNVLLLTYEDMSDDIQSTIRRVASFLGKPLADQDIQKLADHLSFDKMKENKAAVGGQADRLAECEQVHGTKTGFQFLRQGKVDGWKDEFTEELNEKFDEWIASMGIPIYGMEVEQ